MRLPTANMYNPGAPLFQALTSYAGKERASFHTPGHKGNAGLLSELDWLAYDLTELPETGSLYDGGDVIERAEQLAAAAFGADQTIFSAGGCTLCIQTMLLLGVGAGGRILMARNSHRSAVHAAALLGLEPVWVWPSLEKGGQVQATDIETKLDQDKNIRAVYVTSPDYYGRLADIPAISAVCKKSGVSLLVDNAHGSHLGAFSLHPLSLGADMTADSAHKTLPVLTGGAMLHIGKKGTENAISRSQAKAAMALFGSTSPAFPILASLDLARDWWERAGTQAYSLTREAVENLIQTAEKDRIATIAGALHDPARLTLDTASVGISGMQAAEYFRSQHCEPEYADAQYVVFIVTPFNTKEEIGRLNRAIAGLLPALRRGRFLNRKKPADSYKYCMEMPIAAMTPRDALMAPCETVMMKQAAGRIAARAVCPCPPGVAAVVPGETVSEEIAEMLETCGFKSIEVVKRAR